ncbi:DUF2938 family protein [Piscinibacter aquaticus]|uniref:DUF2938 family protein n=1 Tax=Piscinibacter aquaticus TaxID=392597 RepID=A0A5C6U1Z5_9BURK|nr:DUF2938 family protein [Piscinibacter aquaticus]
MNDYLLAYAGGIVGAVLMDIAETLASRAGLTSGVSVALVGRWALGLLRGQWAHDDIARSPVRPGEVGAGWAFHVLVGGGGVALLYAVWLQFTGWTLPSQRLWGGGLRRGDLAAALVAAAAGLWLGLVRAAWAEGGERAPGQHAVAPAVRARRRRRHGTRRRPLALAAWRAPAPTLQSICPVAPQASTLSPCTCLPQPVPSPGTARPRAPRRSWLRRWWCGPSRRACCTSSFPVSTPSPVCSSSPNRWG